MGCGPRCECATSTRRTKPAALAGSTVRFYSEHYEAALNCRTTFLPDMFTINTATDGAKMVAAVLILSSRSDTLTIRRVSTDLYAFVRLGYGVNTGLKIRCAQRRAGPISSLDHS